MSAANATAERQGAYSPPEAGMVSRGMSGVPTKTRRGERGVMRCGGRR